MGRHAAEADPAGEGRQPAEIPATDAPATDIAAELASEGESAAEAPRPADRRLVTMLFVLALAVVVLDQLTKNWAITALTESEARPFIGDLITLQLTFNPGAAFGLASGTTWIFTVIAVVVVGVVIRISRSIHSTAWTVCLALLLGGATGNLLDRLFREPGFPEGHVVDFINYFGRFIGNVADIAIVGAAIGIAVLAIVGIDVDGRRARARASTPEPPGSDA